jgi:broad specificity phosphatase PhoE
VTTILFVRHGETDWNRERRVQGHADTPLNDTGRAQARELASRLAVERIDAVYSSDLARAHETARIVAEPRGLGVSAIRDLRERHFGTWEGMTDDEVLARFPQAATEPWGDGEARHAMDVRVVDAVARIAAAHLNGHVLVVSHGGPMRALLRHCTGNGDGPIPNCHVVRIAVEGGEFRPLD